MRVLHKLLFAVLAVGLSAAGAAPARADEAEGHHRMALDYERNGDLKAACREAHKAIELRPGYAPAWMTLGSLERKKGKLDQALTAFEKVIALSPTYQPAYALSGAVLVRLKRYEEAVPRLQKAVELDGDDMQSVANLGVALRKLGKNAEAIAAMNAAVERHPDDADLLNNLAVALRQERRYEEAIVHLQHALELRDSPEQHRNLAITLRGAERFKEAVPEYEAVLAKNAYDVGALYDLANCYEKLGDNTHAVQMYRRYVDAVRAKDPAAAQRGEDRIKALGQSSF